MKRTTKVSPIYGGLPIVLGLVVVILIFIVGSLATPKKDAVASTFHIDSRVASLTAGTTQETEVPGMLPAGGVTINSQFVLRPLAMLPNTPTTVSASQAISIGRKYANAQPFQATTVLASFTSINSVPPPGVKASANEIQNVPSWIVTFTTNNPQRVAQGRPSSPPVTPAPTHFNIVINASTGAFVLGFFTA